MTVKFTALAALLLTLLALSEASYRTTITIEEENPRGQSCQEQMQMQQQQHRHCMMYMQSQKSSYRIFTNPQQQHLRQCCQSLENMDKECRCEAIRTMVRQQMEEGQMQTEEMQQIMQEAKYLPSKCNLQPQQCQIREA